MREAYAQVIRIGLLNYVADTPLAAQITGAQEQSTGEGGGSQLGRANSS